MPLPINKDCQKCALTLKILKTHSGKRVFIDKPDCWDDKKCPRKRSYYRNLDHYRKKQRETHRYIKYASGNCVICRSSQDIEAHHIIQQKDGGEDKPNNIMTLCKKCHDIITAYQSACKTIQSFQ